MQTGDILFFKGQSVISKIIAKATGSPYTHVAIALSDTLILEADRFINVRIREIKDTEVYTVRRYIHPLTQPELDIMYLGALSMAGNYRYDYLHVFVWFLRLIIHKDISFIGNSRSVYCTELVDLMYELIDVDLVPYRPTGDILPSHLLRTPLLTEVYSTKGRG